MLLLAFDTSTEVTSVALARVDSDSIELLAGEVIDARRAALSRLLPTAATMLSSAGLSASDLDGVVVGQGPGSFTGVRIAVASAKGLAQGLGVPLWAVSTLDAIAQGFTQTDVTLGVVGDAMRGEVYPVLYRCGGGRATRLTPDRVAKPESVAREWAAMGERLLLTGNGLKKYGAVFADALGQSADTADEARWVPSPAGLIAAWVAVRDADRLRDGDPGAVLPVYARISDAEEAHRDRAQESCSRESGAPIASDSVDGNAPGGEAS